MVKAGSASGEGSMVAGGSRGTASGEGSMVAGGSRGTVSGERSSGRWWQQGHREW